jgi:hypothetical protein
LPQALLVKRSSISDSLASSGQASPLIAMEWLQRSIDKQPADSHFAHFGKGDFLWAVRTYLSASSLADWLYDNL